MHIKLHPVTLENRGDLDEIDPGEAQCTWVHSAWYWHQQSIENPNIIFRLIHLDGFESAAGMVAFGPAYRDEKLTDQMDGAYEIIHLVIDHRHQKQGLGNSWHVRSFICLPLIQTVKGSWLRITRTTLHPAHFSLNLGFNLLI